MPDPEAIRFGSTSEVERPIPVSSWDGRFRVWCLTLRSRSSRVANKGLRSGSIDLGKGFLWRR
jgi:hypothetical protein